MSIRGKRLVSDKYAADKVAEMMATLYKWLLGECSKPEFVYEWNKIDLSQYLHALNKNQETAT